MRIIVYSMLNAPCEMRAAKAKSAYASAPSDQDLHSSLIEILDTLENNEVQSNFNGSNIFGTIENCSRHGWFEPLRVNYGAKSGAKWR